MACIANSANWRKKAYNLQLDRHKAVKHYICENNSAHDTERMHSCPRMDAQSACADADADADAPVAISCCSEAHSAVLVSERKKGLVLAHKCAQTAMT